VRRGVSDVIDCDAWVETCPGDTGGTQCPGASQYIEISAASYRAASGVASASRMRNQGSATPADLGYTSAHLAPLWVAAQRNHQQKWRKALTPRRPRPPAAGRSIA
jgi:hypothetical protein